MKSPNIYTITYYDHKDIVEGSLSFGKPVTRNVYAWQLQEWKLRKDITIIGIEFNAEETEMERIYREGHRD